MAKHNDPIENLLAKLKQSREAEIAQMAQQAENTVDLAVTITSAGNVWNPMDHPRNKKGHFVKKGMGIFLFGLVKKAKYLIGGIDLNVNLEPGDVAWKSSSGNIFVAHADGGWSRYVLLAGDSKFKEKKEAPGSVLAHNLKELSQQEGSQWTVVGVAPAVEVPALNEAAAETALHTKVEKGDLLNSAQLALLPAGSSASSISGTVVTKNADGGWYYVKDGETHNFGIWHAGSLTLVSIGDQSKGTPASVNGAFEDADGDGVADAPNVVAQILSGGNKAEHVAIMDALPEGTKIHVYLKGKTSADDFNQDYVATTSDASTAKWQAFVTGNEVPVHTNSYNLAPSTTNSLVVTILPNTSQTSVPTPAAPAAPSAPATPVPPEPVTTYDVGDKIPKNDAEGLASLPAGAVLNDKDGEPWTKGPNGMWGFLDGDFTAPGSNVKMWGPFTVVSVPEAEPEAEPVAPVSNNIYDVGDTIPKGDVAGIDSLPEGSKVNDKDGEPWTKGSNGKWGYKSASGTGASGSDINTWGPLTVVSIPEEEPVALPEPPAPKKQPIVGDKITGAMGAEQILDDLPVGSTVKDKDNDSWKKTASGWAMNTNYMSGTFLPSKNVAKWVPLTVTNVPEPEPEESPKSPLGLGDKIDSWTNLNDLPVGTKISAPKTFGDGQIEATKQPDTSWKFGAEMGGTEVPPAAFMGIEDSYSVSYLPDASTQTSMDAETAPAAVPSVGQSLLGPDAVASMDALPQGSTVNAVFDGEDLVSSKWSYTKGVNGWGTNPTKGGSLTATDLIGSSDGSNAGWDIVLTKIGTAAEASPETPAPVQPGAKPKPGGKNKLKANDPNDAPEPLSTYTSVTNEQFDDVTPVYAGGFQHPVSKDFFPLAKGDSLLQNLVTPANFAVMGADGTKKFTVNKNGKEYKWGSHLPKSNYKIVFVAETDYGDVQGAALPDINDYLKGSVFTHPESGLSVTIGADEVLMQHNFTPHSYLVMGTDGSMKYKIDVKGKKQKAGTNLKPSNYFVAKEGKQPETVPFAVAGSINEKLLALQAADLGDFVELDSPAIVMTKSGPDQWTSSDQGFEWSTLQVAASLPLAGQTMVSISGFPLNPDAMKKWLKDAPEGSTLKGLTVHPGASVATKTTNYWEYNGANWGPVTLGTGITNQMTAAEKVQLVGLLKKKEVNNVHGVPVGDQPALAAWLKDLAPGTSIGGAVWSGSWLKAEDGTWPGNLGSDAFSAIIASTWTQNERDALKVTMKPFVTPGASEWPEPEGEVNTFGFPISSAENVESWLTALPVGAAIQAPTGVVAVKQENGNFQSLKSQSVWTPSAMAESVMKATPLGKGKWRPANKPNTTDPSTNVEKVLAALLVEGQPTTQFGFPIYHETPLAKAFLDNLPVGTVIQTDVTSWSKYEKASPGKWVNLPSDMSAGGGSTTGANLSKTISIGDGPAAKFAQIVSVPETAVAAVATKLAQAKKPPTKKKVKASEFGESSKQFSSQYDFTNWMLSQSYADIFNAASGDPAEKFSPSHYYQSAPLPNSFYVGVAGSKLSADANVVLTKPSLEQGITQAIANLDAAKSVLDLDASAKAKSTALRKKLVQYLNIVQAAKKLEAGELPTEPELSPQQVLAFKWGSKSTWEWDMDYVVKPYVEKFAAVKFVQSVSDLGFDPYNGTQEQYKTYLAGTDAQEYLDYMPSNQIKNLVLTKLGAPNYYVDSYEISKWKKQAAGDKFVKEANAALADKNGTPFTPQVDPKGMGFPDNPAPSNLSDAQWNSIKFALSTDFSQDLTNTPEPSLNLGLPDSMKAAIPPNALKSITVALQALGKNQYDIPALTNTIVGNLLKSGIWYDDNLVYEHSSGEKFSLSPGMKVYKGMGASSYGKSGALWFVPKNPTGQPDSDGDIQMPFYDTDTKTWGSTYFRVTKADSYDLLYTAPLVITSSDATSDGIQFTPEQWDGLSAAEGFAVPKEPNAAQTVQLAKILENHPLKVTQISYKAQTLLLDHPEWVDIIVYKDIKGHYRVYDKTNVATWAEVQNLNPTLKSIADPDNPNDVFAKVNSWSEADVADAYTSVTGKDLPPELDAVQAKVLTMTAIGGYNAPKNLDGNYVPPKITGIKGSLKQLSGSSLGGGRPKKMWVDADGEKFMTKPDDSKRFRPDAEHAANEIARLFNFNVPATDVRVVDGEYSYVQHLAPASGDLTGKGPNDLSTEQLVAAMQGHALDWAISNHDTHDGNIMLTPSGETLKIDLGQAWKALGDDQLKVGWRLAGNFGDIWYDKFYRDIQTGKVDSTKLADVTMGVLRKAKQISDKRDDEYRAQLDFAFQNRTSFGGMSKAEFIDLAMARKHDTFEDFRDFYKSMWAKGGYDWPYTDEQFQSSTLDGTEIHTGLSQDYADLVASQQVQGHSVMIGGPEIEDAHIFMHTSVNAKTKDLNLHGDFKVQPGEGDAAIRAFLAQQGVTDDVVQPKVVPQAVPVAANTVPAGNAVTDALVNYAKTVSTHAGDQKYNTGTVAQAMATQKAIMEIAEEIRTKQAQDPQFVAKIPISGAALSLSVQFQTAHQQQFWLDFVDSAVDQFDAVSVAMNKGEKSPKVLDMPPTYIAPKDIDLSDDPYPVETLTGPNTVITKYSDWKYVAVTNTGTSSVMSQDEYEALQGAQGWTMAQIPAPSAPKAEEPPKPEEPVAVIPKWKITKGNARTYVTGQKAIAPTDNTLLTGERSGEAFQSSVAYEMTNTAYPGLRLQYEPRNQTHSNAGRFQFKYDKWDGSVDSMEKVFGAMRSMGLKLEEADETSLELFYWRHLMGGLLNRKKAHKGPELQTINSFKQAKKDAPNMSPAAEITALKTAFALSMGQESIDRADWRPKFGHERLHLGDENETGRPYWYRPDATIEDYFKWHHGNLPGRTPFGGSNPDAEDIATFSHMQTYHKDAAINAFKSMKRLLYTGVHVSNEEKARFNGKWGTGGSATSDYGYASSRVVYLRQDNDYSGNTTAVAWEPHVLLRSQNYSAITDSYGSIETLVHGHSRNKTSPWNAKESAHNGAGGGEIMLKYQLSTWDDMAVMIVPAETRTKFLEYLHKQGISEIRGIPVEERIVDNSTAFRATQKKVWEMAIEREKQFYAQAKKDQTPKDQVTS